MKYILTILFLFSLFTFVNAENTNMTSGLIEKKVLTNQQENSLRIKISKFSNEQINKLLEKIIKLKSNSNNERIINVCEEIIDIIIVEQASRLSIPDEINLSYKFRDKYDVVYNFIGGVAKVGKNDKWGLIDTEGKEVIPLKYIWLSLNDGIVTACQNINTNKDFTDCGVLDTSGKIVVPFSKKQISTYSEGLACISDNYLTYGQPTCTSVIDKNGNEIYKFGELNTFVMFFKYNNGLQKVSSGLEKGFLDKNGKLVFSGSYLNYQIRDFHDGLILMYDRGGFYDTSFKLVIPTKKYSEMPGDFSEGLARVKTSDGTIAFVDISGNEVLKTNYHEAGNFVNGLVPVSNGKWGFMNISGKIVIDFKYKKVHDFSDGLAAVQGVDDKWGFVDKNGNEVVPLVYYSINDFGNGASKNPVILNSNSVCIKGVCNTTENIGYLYKDSFYKALPLKKY